MTYDTINDAVTMSGGEGALLAGRYRVVRQLGQGGMGSVWLAEDTQLDGKQFAIKMLPSILVSNKRAYRQLKDEALVAMQLVHPNIVQIRAFEENNGNPFLVMDYVDGETLDDYLAEKGGGNLTQSRREAESQRNLEDGRFGCGIPEEDVIRILKPIAAALDYAHGEGVVHRDVKPANIMIRKDGHPYILDFGIAREIQETMTRVTGKLSSGTLLYMSPEQLHGAAPKKEQDIYSFAAMAYECLSGKPPFCRGQIEYQIDNDLPEPLVGASVSLASSVMSGLAKKPEDRPATCLGVLSGDVLTQSRKGARGQRSSDFDRVEHVERVGGRAVSMKPPHGDPIVPQSGRDGSTIRLPDEGARVAPRRNVSGITLPIVFIVAALSILGGVVWYRGYQRQEAARKRAIAMQQEESRKRQEELRKQSEEEKRRAEEVERKKAREAQLEREREEAERKSREAESRHAQERELARGKEEAVRRKAAAAERAASAARAELGKAKALQDSKVALEVLADDPWQYETVSEKLVDEQRDLLSPMFKDMLRCDLERMSLLSKFTANHPDVRAQKAEQERKVAAFTAMVQTFLDKLGGRKESPPTLQVVATVNGAEIEGAVLNDGNKDFVLPIKWTLRKGKTYGPYHVSCERGGMRYEGTFERTTAEWVGTQKINVVLKKSADENASGKGKIAKSAMAKSESSAISESAASEFARSVPYNIRRVHIELVAGRIESAQKIVIDAVSPLEQYQKKLLDSDSDRAREVLKNSPLPVFLYSVANMFWKSAQSEFAKGNRNDDKIKDLLFGFRNATTGKRNGKGAFNLATTVFFSYPACSRALEAGEIVEAIQKFAENNYGAKIGVKNINEQRAKIKTTFGKMSQEINFGVEAKSEFPKHGDVKTLVLPGGAKMEMIYVAPGSFMMGSPTGENGRDDDETQHRVTLTKGFWLGKYEVTQRQWLSVMGDNPSKFSGDDRPVENVSWEDCQRFISKVDDAARRQFGGGARLPMEAEWEYACRARTAGAYGGTGNLDDMGWYYDNSGCATHDVGKKRPNAWGFHDMHGNVWEWCKDWYGDYNGNETDPKGPASGTFRVLRGGSWDVIARHCRSAHRGRRIPGNRDDFCGFRLCCSAGPRE